MKRLRLATAWLSGCSGCHMSLLNLHSGLLEVIGEYELVYSPLLDIKEYPGKVDIALVEGAVSTRHNLEMAKIIRKQTCMVASLGDCAINGNVTAMRNPLGRKAVLGCAYEQQHNQTGGFESETTPLLNAALPLHHVIEVNAFIPGCPPEPEQISAAIKQLSAGL